MVEVSTRMLKANLPYFNLKYYRRPVIFLKWKCVLRRGLLSPVVWLQDMELLAEDARHLGVFYYRFRVVSFPSRGGKK